MVVALDKGDVGAKTRGCDGGGRPSRSSPDNQNVGFGENRCFPRSFPMGQHWPDTARTATVVAENLKSHSFRNAVDRLFCGHVKLPKFAAWQPHLLFLMRTMEQASPFVA